ncbi:hypothetical protein M8C21_002324, partial [Ambrosia artemisiifolia]
SRVVNDVLLQENVRTDTSSPFFDLNALDSIEYGKNKGQPYQPYPGDVIAHTPTVSRYRLTRDVLLLRSSATPSQEQGMELNKNEEMPTSHWFSLKVVSLRPYYCNIGADKAFGCDIIASHYKDCVYDGIKISGINGEVMNGESEFQVGPSIEVKLRGINENAPQVFKIPSMLDLIQMRLVEGSAFANMGSDGKRGTKAL